MIKHRIINLKETKKINFKQRLHIKNGSHDKYPQIDKYSPHAESVADLKCKDNKTIEWARIYFNEMNRILISKGLRVA